MNNVLLIIALAPLVSNDEVLFFLATASCGDISQSIHLVGILVYNNTFTNHRRVPLKYTVLERPIPGILQEKEVLIFC